MFLSSSSENTNQSAGSSRPTMAVDGSVNSEVLTKPGRPLAVTMTDTGLTVLLPN